MGIRLGVIDTISPEHSRGLDRDHAVRSLGCWGTSRPWTYGL